MNARCSPTGGWRRGLRRLRRAARARPRCCRGGRRPRANIHIGIDWLASVYVRPHHQRRPARDRARRRQHRDGLLPLGAPPGRRRRQGGRALRLRRDEGLAVGEGRRDARGHPDPQLPRAQGVRSRRTTANSRACTFEIVAKAVYDDQGPAQRWPHRRARRVDSNATRCWWRSARKMRSRGSSADLRHRVRRMGPAPGWTRHERSRPLCRTCSSAAMRPSDRRTSSRRWRTGHEAAVSIDRLLVNGEDPARAPAAA